MGGGFAAETFFIGSTESFDFDIFRLLLLDVGKLSRCITELSHQYRLLASHTSVCVMG